MTRDLWSTGTSLPSVEPDLSPIARDLTGSVSDGP